MSIKNKYYAGIGSRETPLWILQFMAGMAIHLAKHDYILRSGGAQGADKAFEIGCDKGNGKKEIFLPWKGFEGSNSDLIVKNPLAYEIAKKYHPYWDNLSQGAQALQARNSHQVLGEDLNTPVKFIVCYTKNGKGAGGTGQALRIAKAYNIPIFDCGLYDDLETLKKAYRDFLVNLKTK